MPAQITVYGAPWCPDCRRSKKFLAEMRVPYRWVDIEQDQEGAAVVRAKNDGKQVIPTILFEDGSVLVEPSDDELARKLGLTLRAKRTYYDLIIIGGGPAGLTAAIYGAREGIDTLVIEKSAFGGQAGATERIDNHPGFPEGIKGGDLAERIIGQARRYGVELLPAVGISAIGRSDGFLTVTTETGEEYCSRAAIVATGSKTAASGCPARMILSVLASTSALPAMGLSTKEPTSSSSSAGELGRRGGPIPLSVRRSHHARRVRAQAQGQRAAAGKGPRPSEVQHPDEYRGH